MLHDFHATRKIGSEENRHFYSGNPGNSNTLFSDIYNIKCYQISLLCSMCFSAQSRSVV